MLDIFPIEWLKIKKAEVIYFYKKDVKETSTALYSICGAIIMKEFVYSIRRAMIHKSHGMVQLLDTEIEISGHDKK